MRGKNEKPADARNVTTSAPKTLTRSISPLLQTVNARETLCSASNPPGNFLRAITVHRYRGKQGNFVKRLSP